MYGYTNLHLVITAVRDSVKINTLVVIFQLHSPEWSILWILVPPQVDNTTNDNTEQ